MLTISLRIESLESASAQFTRTIPTATIVRHGKLGKKIEERVLGCKPSHRKTGEMADLQPKSCLIFQDRSPFTNNPESTVCRLGDIAKVIAGRTLLSNPCYASIGGMQDSSSVANCPTLASVDKV